jgi:hypothetical protein
LTDHDEYAALRRLRAQVGAAEALAAAWERPGPLPEGWRCEWDRDLAAVELRRALTAGDRHRPS